MTTENAIFVANADTCFAHAELAILRLHRIHHERTRAWHAGVNSCSAAVNDVRAAGDLMEAPAIARCLWALGVLVGMRKPWSDWSEGMSEACSAGLQAVNRLMLTSELLVPADAEHHPFAVASDVAPALGYNVRCEPGSREWYWVLPRRIPVASLTRSPVTFGSATRAWLDACEHALDQIVYPSWQWPREQTVPSRTIQLTPNARPEFRA